MTMLMEEDTGNLAGVPMKREWAGEAHDPNATTSVRRPG